MLHYIYCFFILSKFVSGPDVCPRAKKKVGVYSFIFFSYVILERNLPIVLLLHYPSKKTSVPSAEDGLVFLMVTPFKIFSHLSMYLFHCSI